VDELFQNSRVLEAADLAKDAGREVGVVRCCRVAACGSCRCMSRCAGEARRPSSRSSSPPSATRRSMVIKRVIPVRVCASPASGLKEARNLVEGDAQARQGRAVNKEEAE